MIFTVSWRYLWTTELYRCTLFWYMEFWFATMCFCKMLQKIYHTYNYIIYIYISIFSIYAITSMHLMSFQVMYRTVYIYSIISYPVYETKLRLVQEHQSSFRCVWVSKMPKSSSLQSAFSVILPFESKSSGAMYLPNDSLDSRMSLDISWHFKRPIPN